MCKFVPIHKAGAPRVLLVPGAKAKEKDSDLALYPVKGYEKLSVNIKKGGNMWGKRGARKMNGGVGTREFVIRPACDVVLGSSPK